MRIAIVVTIVVLIILAVISVNLVMNGNIIGRAEQSKDIQAKATELERLELVKGDVAIDNKGKVTVDKYIEETIKQGITTEDEIEDNGDGSKNIITDNGWNVNIAPDPDNENNVIITIEGKGNELPPRISKLTVTEKNNTTATVTIEVKRAEGATYKYYCKEIDGEYGKPFYTGTDLSKDKTEIELDDKQYVIKVEATNQYGTRYKEQKIGDIETVAAAPKLTEGMIPVKWNGNNWEKTTENDKEWYSYTKVDKKWANVVLGEAKFTVKNGKEILNENEPYSQLVWIPRYAYRITNMYHYDDPAGVAGSIKIKFINNAVTNTDSNGDSWSENYPTVTASGTEIGAMDDYVVHPAFNFGTSRLNGIWVGKYESSFQGTGTTEGSGRANDPSKTMMIRAEVSSWRSITIDNIYNVCLNMNKADNVYNLNTSDSVVAPHLMRNDEWGAVAYLSKSKYGKYNEEVRINNNINYITGNGASSDNASSSITVNSYRTQYGQAASTTGNIYGIYDMVGGAAEYVAAYVNNGNVNIETYGASIKTAAESSDVNQKRYVNRYYSTSTNNGATSTQVEDYEYANPNHTDATGDYKHYGDAVWETATWYADDSYFPHSSNPFFVRGGNTEQTSRAGMFALDCFNGSSNTGSQYLVWGFRVVVPVL